MMKHCQRISISGIRTMFSLFSNKRSKHRYTFSKRIFSVLFSTTTSCLRHHSTYYCSPLQFAALPGSSGALQLTVFGKNRSKNNNNWRQSNTQQSAATTSLLSTDMNTLQFWDQGRSLALRHSIMPLSFDSHKGSSGRVGVLGGSGDFTGAPFYAAMASLNAGADLSFVFCANEAALPIKSYSPELMVTPVYSVEAFEQCIREGDKSDNSEKREPLIQDMVGKVQPKLEQLHVLVVGPGLGRCPIVSEATARIISYAKSQNLPLVLDADALWMLAQPEYRSLLVGYDRVVLTPNVVEYKRLMPGDDSTCTSVEDNPLRDATIVRKGQIDSIIKNETEVYSCQETGGMKRSGGIGDVLAGTLGTLVAWNNILSSKSENETDHSGVNHLALSCWTACCFVKRATKRAFEQKKRSMTAPDVLENLGPAIDEMTSDDTTSKL